MPESQRQSWVTAGRNIQTFINLSHARDMTKVRKYYRKSSSVNCKMLISLHSVAAGVGH